MSYVDGFLIPIAKKNVNDYKRQALLGKKAWMKHGAVSYMEAVGDDLKSKWGISFPNQMKLKPGETVVFSFIVFKSKAHRNRVNAKVMKEFDGSPSEMPFDIKRMVYGGFKAIVEGK